jgi:hypothetical protein
VGVAVLLQPLVRVLVLHHVVRRQIAEARASRAAVCRAWHCSITIVCACLGRGQRRCPPARRCHGRHDQRMSPALEPSAAKHRRVCKYRRAFDELVSARHVSTVRARRTALPLQK